MDNMVPPKEIIPKMVLNIVCSILFYGNKLSVEGNICSPQIKKFLFMETNLLFLNSP